MPDESGYLFVTAMNHRISRIVSPILLVSTLVCIPSCRGAEGSAGGQEIPASELSSVGEELVPQLWSDMKERNVESIAPGFQSVHQDGMRDREAELKLIEGLNLGEYTLSDFNVTQAGSVIIATYCVSVEETIAGERLSREPTPRLSVFLHADDAWLWIAHTNARALK